MTEWRTKAREAEEERVRLADRCRALEQAVDRERAAARRDSSPAAPPAGPSPAPAEIALNLCAELQAAIESQSPLMLVQYSIVSSTNSYSRLCAYVSYVRVLQGSELSQRAECTAREADGRMFSLYCTVYSLLCHL